MTAGMRARVPRGSRCLIRWRSVSSLGFCRAGSVKKKVTMLIARAPKGKLMKKHQRQVYCRESVRNNTTRRHRMGGPTYYFVSKDTTKERSGNRSYTVHTSNEATAKKCQRETSGCSSGSSLTSRQGV